MKNKKLNILFKGGLLCILLSAFYFTFKYIFDLDIADNTKGQGLPTLFEFNIFFALFFIAIIGPITEELAFRGFFVMKKWFLVIPCVLLLFYFFNSKYSLLLISIGIIIFFIAFVLYIKKSSYQHTVLFAVTNSLAFASMHYSFSDFLILDSYFMVLIQLGIGLILVWITINFNLIKSMLVHAMFNFLLFFPLFIGSINFEDQEVNTIKTENFVIEWQEVSSFKINKSYGGTKSKFEGKNVTFNLYFDTYQQLYNENINDSLQWIENPIKRYNIRIEMKDSISSLSKKYYQILKKLESEELIEFKK